MKKIIGIVLSLVIMHTSSITPAHSVESFEQYIADQGIERLEFCFFDILGTLRNIIVTPSHMHTCLKHGIAFDGSSIPGYTSITKSDLMLKPDLATCVITPTTLNGKKYARILCDVYENEHTPYKGDPRYLLKQTMLKAEQAGYIPHMGAEVEFFLYKDGVPLDTYRYCQAPYAGTHACHAEVILSTLLDHGITVEKWHHEVAQGQYEVSIRYADALTMADQILLTRYLIKRAAADLGLQATFMPKPCATQNGSGMHTNMSLYSIAQQHNAFYDAQNHYHLSDVAFHFLAGVMNHIQDITLALNPTVNSFKRLLPGFEAPIYLCWGEKNRSALIRVPRINDNQSEAARLELRSPDSCCNPYIAFTLLIQAGLEGIEQQQVPMPPTEKNVYHMNAQERAQTNFKNLPTSLEEALNNFTQSSFAQTVLGNLLHTNYIHLKTKEIASFNATVTEWELLTEC